MTFRHILAACAAALSLAVAVPAFAAVDANQASATDLESVKGIGPGLSAKILAARKQGPFKNWTDLVDRVSGVGPGNAARFSANGLTVAGSAYSGAGANAAPAAATKAPAAPAAPTKR